MTASPAERDGRLPPRLVVDNETIGVPTPPEPPAAPAPQTSDIRDEYDSWLRAHLAALNQETKDHVQALERLTDQRITTVYGPDILKYLGAEADRLLTWDGVPPRVLILETLEIVWAAGRGYGRSEEPPFA
jgi:hypothetical protein